MVSKITANKVKILRNNVRKKSSNVRSVGGRSSSVKNKKGKSPKVTRKVVAKRKSKQEDLWRENPEGESYAKVVEVTAFPFMDGIPFHSGVTPYTSPSDQRDRNEKWIWCESRIINGGGIKC
ncbi:hypothetical protein CEXT_97881 [Caerostris extrusa]|uniref:Uncharacterized protein n=1 Tax=Caerostris extrusa TaxID=172846 RepID=A0AAV4NUN8_CAEEX|nr:hypothetical protein CEXT_97881 [Caerostris extrusa]